MNKKKVVKSKKVIKNKVDKTSIVPKVNSFLNSFFEKSIFLKYLVVYFFTMSVLFCILLAVISFIPYSAIKENVIESVSIVNHDYMFPTGHNYEMFDIGEVIITESNYLMDENKPVKSLIEMNYIGSGFFSQLNDRSKITKTEYSRYWIGMVIYSRILYVFTNIHGIRIINAIIFAVFSFILLRKIFKESKSLAAACFLGLVFIGVHSFVKSVQFFAVPLLSIIASIFVIDLYKKDNKHVDIYFFVVGMLTAFFDMLTTETLTITIPMFIYCYLHIKDNKELPFKKFIKILFLWGVGYVLSFSTKWLIDIIYYGFDYIKYIFARASIRVNESYYYNYNNIFSLLLADFGLLFPMCNFKYGWIVTVLMFIFFIYNFIFYVDKRKYIYLIIICFIPILRYIVIFSHSELLYTFTYRALLPIIIFMLFICFRQVENIIVNNKKS